MYSLQSSSQAVRRQISGRSSLSHRILGMMSLAVGMLPVCWKRKEGVSPCIRRSACSTLRTSNQLSMGVSGRHCSSTGSRLNIWAEMPTPRISSGDTPDCSMTWRVVLARAPHSSSGSCSAQPGWG